MVHMNYQDLYGSTSLHNPEKNITDNENMSL